MLLFYLALNKLELFRFHVIQEQLLYFFILFYDLLPELTAILFVFSHILEEGIVVGVDNLHPDWYDLFRNCSIVQDLERFVEVRLSRVNCRDHCQIVFVREVLKQNFCQLALSVRNYLLLAGILVLIFSENLDALPEHQ